MVSPEEGNPFVVLADDVVAPADEVAPATPVQGRGGPPPPQPRSAPGRVRWTRRLVPVAVCVIVALYALIPLTGTRIFYFWDDSAVAFLPHWYRLGEALRSGHWPMLVPDMWMGGNLAAEAQLGVWNPVVCLNAVLVSLLPDLALGALLIKVEFLVLLALGGYLLAREYGARPGPAAVVAVALPVSGCTLYFDAATWISGLMGLAFVSHLWWSVRRFARGRLNPLVPVLVGALLMTLGSPYGALGAVVVFAAVLAEQLVRRAWHRVVPLVAVGLAVGVTAAPAFLPLLGTAEVTWRTDPGVVNDGFLVPAASDLLMLSAPTYTPLINNWQFGYLTFPAMYLAWFALPLLPWLRPGGLTRDVGRLVGLGIFGVLYLLMTLAPSNLWLFRWPVRVVEYLYLPLCVALALLLDAGLRTDRWRARVAGSAVLIALPAYLSWAAHPGQLRHLLWGLGVAGLLAAALWLARVRPGLLPAGLIAGTGVVLAGQISLYPGNYNVTPWYAPHHVATMRAAVADRYVGNTLQLYDLRAVGVHAAPDQVWRDILPGNLGAVAGVRSLNAYTGIGFAAFSDGGFRDNACLNWHGGVCRELYDRLWSPDRETGVRLADLLRLETVVVANRFHPGEGSLSRAPSGWRIAERTRYATILRREAALPWPDGRVTVTAPGVTVLEDVATVAEPGERIRYTGSGRVLLATLAWPGWRATADGRPVPVVTGPFGLVALDLPAAAPGGSTVRLEFSPPAFGLSAALLGLGVTFGFGYGAWYARGSITGRVRRRVEGRSVSDGY